MTYCTIKPKLKNYGDGLPSHKLKLAINYIHDNLDRTITLTELANLVNMSQYYFCRLFGESTGIAPYQYVIQQRVAKAKGLIKHSTMPLADISFECGFSSQSQMTQHFRKLTGMTPKKYRDLAERGGRNLITNSPEHFF
ncbi:MAG: AraC family transcriptional regulator [Pleurocapsa sp. MO_192.B19]|nr:AraC family transcriptional regulator [Pleurocapsa sp. MO_192.B19]